MLTWVYPFQEFHENVFGASPRPAGVFFSDWFIRNAVNAGLPLNSVVSADNFLSSRQAHPEAYEDTILLSPVPAAGSPREEALLDHLRRGGKLFLYGSVTNAGKGLLDLLNIQLAEPLSGELEVRSGLAGDTVNHGTPASRMLHRDILSDGGIDTVLAGPNPPDFEICATVSHGSSERVFAVARTSAPAGSPGCGAAFLQRLRTPICLSPTIPSSVFKPNA